MVDTPQPDPVGGRGGATSTGGRSGSAGALGAGASGRANPPDDAGSSGAGGRASNGGTGSDEPDAGSVVTPTPRDPGDYCDAVSLVFAETCGNGSCHTNHGVPIGDFGVGPEEAASYVGRGSVRNPACGLIINPINPQESLILTKVTGDYPQDLGCGGRMPIGSFEITDAQIDCIADWVEQFRN